MKFIFRGKYTGEDKKKFKKVQVNDFKKNLSVFKN